MTTRALVLLAASIAAIGCSSTPADEGATAPASATPSGPCAAKAAACLVDQMACAVDDAGVAACAPCPSGQYAASDGGCTALSGKALTHDFPDYDVGPGEEVAGLCQSWTLNNPTELWVNAVEMEQDVRFHHSNWTFVPDDQFDGPDGSWKCHDRGYDQLTGALAGGVLYAQSTQATREVQKFPDGAVIRIPPYSRIVSDVHLLNTESTPAHGHATLAIWALDPAEIQVKLVPFHITYDGLAIPPHASSRFSGACDLDHAYEQATNAPFAMQVYYILPHTHSLATRFFVDVLGGPHDGEHLLDVSGYDRGARGRRFDTPYDMAGASGFRMGCEFQNPRGDVIHYGIGDQEMCETLGFGASPVAFESRMPNAEQGPDDGATKTFTSSCSTIAFPWDWSKPGGPGPK